jgi:hypothetical protein
MQRPVSEGAKQRSNLSHLFSTGCEAKVQPSDNLIASVFSTSTTSYTSKQSARGSLPSIRIDIELAESRRFPRHVKQKRHNQIRSTATSSEGVPLPSGRPFPGRLRTT